MIRTILSLNVYLIYSSTITVITVVTIISLDFIVFHILIVLIIRMSYCSTRTFLLSTPLYYSQCRYSIVTLVAQCVYCLGIEQ